MPGKRITFSVASLSWIHPQQQDSIGGFTFPIPVTDPGHPGKTITRRRIVAKTGYRFVNLLEGWVQFDEANRSTEYDFTSASRIYRSTSLGFESESFRPVRRCHPTIRGREDGIHFYQLVGARTQTPEKIASFIGGPLAREVAEEILVYPPIWSALSLDIYPDGSIQHRIVRHSVFPNLSYYVLDPKIGQYRLHRDLDARNKIDLWKRQGWDSGNPWRIKNPSGFGAPREDWQRDPTAFRFIRA